MEKYSKGYKLLCRFFKECGIYHDFMKYQREGDKYVSFFCKKIPTTSYDIVGDLAHTSFTAWLERIHGRSYRTFYELFKAWLCVYYPKFNIDKNCIRGEYLEIINNVKINRKKLKQQISR